MSLAQAQREINRLKRENASLLERLAILARSSATVFVAKLSDTQLAFARLEQQTAEQVHNLQRDLGVVTEQLGESKAKLLEVTTAKSAADQAQAAREANAGAKEEVSNTVSPTDAAWLCALFSAEGLGGSEKIAAARNQFLSAVAKALPGIGSDTQLASLDPAAVRAAVLADQGASFFAFLAEALVEQHALERSVAAVSTNSKDAGEFTFGNQKDFNGGVQGMIGVSLSEAARILPVSHKLSC